MENENYRWPISRDFPLAGPSVPGGASRGCLRAALCEHSLGRLNPTIPWDWEFHWDFHWANHRKVIEAQMMKEFVYISQTKNIMLISFDVNVHSLRTSAGIPALVPFRPWWWWTGVPSLAFSPRWSRGCTPRCRARLIHCDFLMWKDDYLKKGEVG